MQASKEQPKVVKIAVVVQTEGEDTQLNEERFVQGKTREEVMAEAMSALFDEKPSKSKKPRAKRRTKAEMESIKSQEKLLEVPAPEGTISAEPAEKKKKEKAWA